MPCPRPESEIRTGRAQSFMLLGLLLFCLNYVLTYYAQQYITSALSAIAFSTMLWMNILNARIFFGVRAGWRVLIGSVLGIAGIAVLFLPQIGEFSFSDATLFGTSICVVGAYIASLGNMASQSAQSQGLPIMQSNAWGMLYGAILTGAIALAQGLEFTFEASLSYVVSLLYLSIFGSVIAFGAYLTLLGRIGAHRAGYAMVMFPVVALVISFFFEGLEPRLSIFGGIALVIAGNLLILESRKRVVVRVAATAGSLAPVAVTAASDPVAGQSSSPPCQEMNFQTPSSRTKTSV
ncbi:MAG: EamA family transporter [Gammaproteobacteria bacterium]|nr:EamA family transporter [Gammaproteobacteria bacterium]